MAATGRLWRRAPAWRLLLITALATTGLAAMFPPRLPDWVRTLQPGALPAPAPGAVPTAHFTPQAAPILPDVATLVFPPPGVDRSGVVPFAGHQLPLPAGKWQGLVLARGSKPIHSQIMVFSRVEEGALTGMLQVAAPDPIALQTSPFDVTPSCLEPGTIESMIAPEPLGQNPLTHECWRLGAFGGADLPERARGDGVMLAALARLHEMDVRFPDRFVVVDYLRSEPSGFMSARLFLPDKEAASASERHRLVAWTRRYVAALRAGYAGGLRDEAFEREP